MLVRLLTMLLVIIGFLGLVACTGGDDAGNGDGGTEEASGDGDGAAEEEGGDGAAEEDGGDAEE